MNEIMVSVRMPGVLLNKLRKYTHEQDYMDQSEAIRSILRDKWYEEQFPLIYHINRMKEEIKEEIRKLRKLSPGSVADKRVRKKNLKELKELGF